MRFPRIVEASERGYVGGTKDATGLTRIGARDYDPALQRFITVDPVQDLADPQQWNPYLYSNNSPITKSDPTGLIACTDYYSCGYQMPDHLIHPKKDKKTPASTGGSAGGTYGSRQDRDKTRKKPSPQGPPSFNDWRTERDQRITYIAQNCVSQQYIFCAPKVAGPTFSIPKIEGPWYVQVTNSIGGIILLPYASREFGLATGPKLSGSGPMAGVIEVSARVKSVGAMKNYTPRGRIEYVFDPIGKTFAVGRPSTSSGLRGSQHEQLAQSIGVPRDSKSLVGGMLTRRSNGILDTDEYSGHYGENWTDPVRQEFVRFMSDNGIQVTHGP